MSTDRHAKLLMLSFPCPCSWPHHTNQIHILQISITFSFSHITFMSYFFFGSRAPMDDDDDCREFGITIIILLISCLLHLVATAYFFFLELLGEKVSVLRRFAKSNICSGLVRGHKHRPPKNDNIIDSLTLTMPFPIPKGYILHNGPNALDCIPRGTIAADSWALSYCCNRGIISIVHSQWMQAVRARRIGSCFIGKNFICLFSVSTLCCYTGCAGRTDDSDRLRINANQTGIIFGECNALAVQIRFPCR